MMAPFLLYCIASVSEPEIRKRPHEKVEKKKYQPGNHLTNHDVGHHGGRVDVELVQVPDGGFVDLVKVLGVVVRDTDVVDWQVPKVQRKQISIERENGLPSKEARQKPTEHADFKLVKLGTDGLGQFRRPFPVVHGNRLGLDLVLVRWYQKKECDIAFPINPRQPSIPNLVNFRSKKKKHEPISLAASSNFACVLEIKTTDIPCFANWSA